MKNSGNLENLSNFSFPPSIFFTTFAHRLNFSKHTKTFQDYEEKNLISNDGPRSHVGYRRLHLLQQR